MVGLRKLLGRSRLVVASAVVALGVGTAHAGTQVGGGGGAQVGGGGGAQVGGGGGAQVGGGGGAQVGGGGGSQVGGGGGSQVGGGGGAQVGGGGGTAVEFGPRGRAGRGDLSTPAERAVRTAAAQFRGLIRLTVR